MSAGEITSICISGAKHVKKEPVDEALLIEEYGIEGDAHAGFAHRQVSLLADESIEEVRAQGLEDLKPGDFAENMVTRGVNLRSLNIGDRLGLGERVVLEVTQIGKECHDHCSIFERLGDCLMPREGVFTRVVKGGRVAPGDEIRIMER
ncbi:MAG: MOSC domain-containing protein [Actinomycetota bacterium]|nr:MOSC domain-containing protein [Actinomycetota bacterium]